MESIRKALTQVKIVDGEIADVIEQNIPYFPNTDLSNLSPVTVPVIFVRQPRYIVETEEGTELFPKIGSEFKKGDKVKIVETCYCGLLKSKRLEKKSV